MKLKKLIIVIAVIFAGLATKANGQWAIMKADADSLVRLGSQYIYNIKFDSAEVCFNKVKKMYPEHPAGYFLDAMVEWWRITLFKNTDRYDKPFLKKIEKVIEICDELLEENEYDINAVFFKAGAMGYRGRYYAIEEEWYKAARDGASAFSFLQKCQEIAPANSDIQLGTGIYNYFAIAIPEKYPLVKPLLSFLPPGDKRLGLAQLRAAKRHARYAGVEAEVVLLQIYYSFEKDNIKAFETAQSLHERYPDNAYFHRYYARILVRQGVYSKFEEEWRKVLINCMDKKPGYDNMTARESMYYIGLALKRKQDYENALRYFLKADEGNEVVDKDEDTGFLVNTKLYIAYLYDLRGQRNIAKKYYRQVLDLEEFESSHNKARKYLEKAYGS